MIDHMSNPPAFKNIRPELPQHAVKTAGEPHWLLEHPYGWSLLASEIRRIHPEIRCPRYTPCPELFPHLEELIDQLGLRAWPRPIGWREQLHVAKLIFQMFWALNMGNELPTWNAPASAANGRSC